ncbi:IPT/TIG domain-containing protein [Bacteroides sp.]|uniref:IPT/TIG domain-containing protein n=1 Tax=Bacteroides sp. TaxID=29523 RepID=UPI00258AEB9A|nr:IPT/TIG domain-containing protein [Bacteroides sp.]
MKKNIYIIIFLGSLLIGCLGGCSDDAIKAAREVSFIDYIPKEGEAGGSMTIEGMNITADIAKIHVTVGGVKAKVKTCDGSAILCEIPANKIAQAEVNVKIMSKDGMIEDEYTFPNKFSYLSVTGASVQVSTICGVGTTPIDGSFLVASFGSPNCLRLDPVDNRTLFMVEDKFSGGTGDFRRINMDAETVETLITRANAGWDRVRSLSWSKDKNTLYMADCHNPSTTMPSISYYLRSEDFKIMHNTYLDGIGQTARADVVSCNPYDNTLFYFSRYNSTVFKLFCDESTLEWKVEQMFSLKDLVGDQKQPADFVFHPSGEFAYICMWQTNGILKAKYNKNTKTLEKAELFVGANDDNAKDFVNGKGTDVRFNHLGCGCFVKNSAYTGQDDEYDFYVCDQDNHCIRKVTPDGTVSTFVGRAKTSGNVDGEGGTEALFNGPWGITYDEENTCFYISEANNRRIRKVQIED